MDAAALASTAPLDLSDPATAPDFTALSFYKIFGFPNIGALIVRKNSAHVLESRRYFGGGTVEMIISINDTWHAKKDSSIHDRLEDGTLPFHSIFALDHAMNVHERLYGPNPMKFISMHTAQLGRQLYEGLKALKHGNGTPLVRIYKDDNAIYGDPTVQGSTVAFNVQTADATLVGFEDVEEAADDRNIYVRSGSLCNPGGVATYLDWSPAEMRAAYAAGHRCTNPTQIMLGKATGVVRVSLGAMSTASDIVILLNFLEEMYLDRSAVSGPTALPIADHTRTTMYSSRTGSTSQSVPSSPGLRSPSLKIPHALHIPAPTSAPPTPGASMPGAENDAASAVDSGIGDDTRPKAPPFVPSDYVKLRRPWEDEMRRQYAVGNLDAKVREQDSTTSSVRNQTPSVKARKFGRSVVNLLRTKSHFADGNGGRPPMPASPIPPETPDMPHPGERRRYGDGASGHGP